MSSMITFIQRFILMFWVLTTITVSAQDTTQMALPTLGTAQAITADGKPVSTATVFTGGISVNGATYQAEVTQSLADAVKVEGNIQVDTTHLGQLADLVVYAKLEASTVPATTGQFYQLDTDHYISVWDQQPAHLVPFRRNVILSAHQSVSMYSGTFYLPGLLHIFFGYRLQDGTLVTNTDSIVVTINSSQSIPRFNSAPCPFSLPEGSTMTEGQEFSCGYVNVPEQHAQPEGRQIRLAVAIFHSSNQSPAPDPLIMEQGGPGGSTLDAFAISLLDPEDTTIRPLLQRQDIILIEQRGTLYSEPFLFCEEVKQFRQDVLEHWLTMTNEEGQQRSDQALMDCRDRFLAQGINLSAYNSVENAADIAMVVNVLGYQQFNYYGVSYGTMLGQHLMRDYPQQLRSVILDSVVPLETNFIPLVANTLDRSLKLLFSKCAADSTCQRQFPRLETVFLDTVDRLNLSPTFILPEDQAGQSYVLPFTGDDLGGQVFNLLYATDIIPLLPAFIYTVADDNYELPTRIFELLTFDDTGADGMFNSVMCAEDADYTDADYHSEGLYPQVVEIAKGQDIREMCALWQVTPLGDYVDEPVVNQLPTLILSGEFDPVTPSSFGETLAQHLPNSHAYTFPGVGHGVISGGDCPQSMMLAFLAQPDQAPVSDCITSMGIEFAKDIELTAGKRFKAEKRFLGKRFKIFQPPPAPPW